MIKLVERDGCNALGLVEIKLDLLFGGKRMDHVGDCADEVDGIEHIDGLRAVRQCDRDLVVFAHADRFQRPGALFNFCDQGLII